MPMSERLAYAARMLVVGLGMVFVVLAILWGVLALSHVLLGKKTAGKSAAPEKKQSVLVQAAPVAKPAPTNDDAALIAVITAAIQASMAEQGNAPAGTFRVVSFRPISGNRAWNSK